MSPRVSVIMPVYNGEKYLHYAIESILIQTFTDFELIIIDDGSVDNTAMLLREYAHRDSRIRLHTLNSNMGIANARNLGLKLAHGEFIANLDSDDVSLPERFATQITYLDSHPKVGVIGTAAQIIDENGVEQGRLDYPTNSQIINWALCFYDPIINPSVMFRREAAIAVGGYRKEYPPTEDYDLWARLSERTQLANLPESLILLRKHSQNATVTKRRHNLDQSAKISRDLFRKQTGIELKVTPIELSWDPRRISWEEIELLSSAILTMYNQFTAQPGLTQTEKAYLRRETALQLFRLVRNTSSPHGAINIFFRALRTDPLALSQALRLALHRLLS